MKYLRDIIPADKRVFTEYFQEQSDYQSKKYSKENALRYYFAVTLLIISLAFLSYFPVAVLIALAAFVILPLSKAWIEQTLAFELTFKVSAITVSILLVLSMGIDKIYRDRDEVIKLAERKEAEVKEERRVARELYYQHRMDSIKKIAIENQKLINANKYEDVLAQYISAIKLTETTEEQLFLAQERQKTERSFGLYLVSKQRYKQAIPVLSNSIAQNSEAILYYNRGVCYANLGHVREAVYDLRVASKAGSAEAENLHERINPIRQRVSYYVTRCCDGSTSNAKGRGACSHHGGVCNWNDPVYESYRKYE